MSLAASALPGLRAVAELFARHPGLPPQPACSAGALLDAADAAPHQPSEAVLEQLRRTLQEACAAGALARLAPKILRDAPMVFWHGEPQAAMFPGLREAFLNGANAKPRWLKVLIEAWLRDFGPGRVALVESGHAVAALLPRLQENPRLRFWLDAHRAFNLFDAEAGLAQVAHSLLYGPGEVAEVLKRTGMDDPLRARGGYFRAVVGALLDRLPNALREPRGSTAWSRVAGVVEMPDDRRDLRGRPIAATKLRFGELVRETGRGCLLPWLQPPAPVLPHEPIQAFLVRNLGDPRLEPTKWRPVGEDATAMVRGWLAGATLEMFLSFIDQATGDAQWQARRKFWRACLRKMPGAETWVVLGHALARRASAVHGLHQSFGRIGRGANAASQAVLLMRLGDLVLSEWSNVGPVRAWRFGDRNCPLLYQREYDAHALQATSLDFPPHPVRWKGGSSGGKGLWHLPGLWQGCAAELLRARLGLVLTEQDYM